MQTLMDDFFSNAMKFGWGSLVNVVPKATGGDPTSIFTKFTEVKIYYVKNKLKILEVMPPQNLTTIFRTY